MFAGEDSKENHSFIYFCRHFHSLGLPVPTLYANRTDQGIYIIEDLGDKTMAERISDPSISREEISRLYGQSVKDLVDFQILGHTGLDYENNCHQYPVFDRKNAEADLEYFVKHFLMLLRNYSTTSLIERELDKLTEILAEPQPMFFLYRDFQCRNIIVRPDKSLGYIDFQAGRRGPLQFDIATLLYASKATVSDDERKIILHKYLDQLERVITLLNDSTNGGGKKFSGATPINRSEFLDRYYFFVLFRILRALGVYLFLAVEEGHWRFVEAVPLALRNIAGIFSEHIFLAEAFPELHELTRHLSSEESFLTPATLMKLIISH